MRLQGLELSSTTSVLRLLRQHGFPVIKSFSMLRSSVSDQFPNPFLLQPTSKVDETKRNKSSKTETKRSGWGASVIEESNGQRQ